ncbi:MULTISPECIES: hypothetical protein [Halolamina]|uniref:Metallo-beta-lactamase superfamily protein n=1 Tax=Halolamina pelagica TaxID=699431 RepID=A0A1I5NQ32_9EURY|nr:MULTISPECIES: hypothetical protein [Halolamina]NHX36425.1 hypothetical protein [Halolamina sp. R1-12]SFP23913.1 hypothetical protein SAMN05216277_102141 [Halolamina pelagica]
MSTLEVVDRWDGGISWTLADEVDRMHRTSHAIETEAGVWVIDPIDAPGLDDELASLGDVVGVTLLLDRHKRDGAAVAERHDVPVSLPETLAGVADELECETTVYSRALPETDFRTITVVDNRFWHEVALYERERDTLIVPEAVGTVEFFRTDGERLGVHPALRLFPPRKALGTLGPDRVVVGHGPGVFDDAATALRVALARSRKSAPKYYAGLLLSPLR